MGELSFALSWLKRYLYPEAPHDSRTVSRQSPAISDTLSAPHRTPGCLHECAVRHPILWQALISDSKNPKCRDLYCIDERILSHKTVCSVSASRKVFPRQFGFA